MNEVIRKSVDIPKKNILKLVGEAAMKDIHIKKHLESIINDYCAGLFVKRPRKDA